MNLGMLQRAIARHRLVKNRAPYEALLARAAARGDVWFATQREVAAWWEARGAAALDIRVAEPGAIRVSCPLANAVAEIYGKELRVPPFDHPVAAHVPRGALEISYHCSSMYQDFAREMFTHLGYGHVAPTFLDDVADIRMAALDPALRALIDTAVAHQFYGGEEIAAVRAAVRAAHERRGVPELRIWSLPHRDGRPYRAALSPRFDVDKAIVNMPLIHALEGKYGARSTAYVRPCGPFYGAREIRRYLAAHRRERNGAARRVRDDVGTLRERVQGRRRGEAAPRIHHRSGSGGRLHARRRAEQQSHGTTREWLSRGRASNTRRCIATATSTRSISRPA